MAKDVQFGDVSRSKIIKGVDVLANAVRVTLGPKGRNVILQQPFKPPHVTKDGVTVAREIFLKDPIEDMGAQMVKEVASLTAVDAGDGTTTASVLAQSIVKEGYKYVTSGMNPMDLKRGMDIATDAIVEQLDSISKPCNSNSEIEQVGSISANSDESIGKLIAEAMDRVGQDGVITVEEGQSLKNDLEVVDGMQFDRGYLSPYFMNNQEKLNCVLEEPYILLTDESITNIQNLVPLLEKVIQQGKPLLVIAEDVEGEALGTLVMNTARGIVKACAVKAPGFGERRREMLQDMAVLTKGTVISEDVGLSLDKVTLDHLGTAQRVEINKETTTIVDGAGTKEDIQQRIDYIKKLLDDTESSYDKEKAMERLAKLAGGVAVIKVGAATEVEAKEKKDRIDDALHATRAAVEDGIVAGGGIALLRAKQQLADLTGKNADQDAGIKIVLDAIESPLRQIVANAGVSADVVIANVLKGEGTYGYDAAEDTYGDMIEKGIIDPTKVTKTALLNASSIAGMIITSECSIVDIEEKNKPEDE
tara:strand:+ start:10786 stop:12384 length:1599 start_codon:yes stop_codon:yes gene_type:complete